VCTWSDSPVQQSKRGKASSDEQHVELFDLVGTHVLHRRSLTVKPWWLLDNTQTREELDGQTLA
jgi:hypothetical protein